MKLDSSREGYPSLAARAQMMDGSHVLGEPDFIARAANPSTKFRFFEKEEKAFAE